MSVLLKAKRRFLFVCFVTSILLMTVSWHLLYQSYETTIVKTSRVKTIIEEPGHVVSRIQINTSDVTFKSDYGENARQGRTMIPEDIKYILRKMTNILQNSSHLIGREEQKYIDLIKEQLMRIPAKNQIPGNSKWQKSSAISNNINTTVSHKSNVLKNISSSISKLVDQTDILTSSISPLTNSVSITNSMSKSLISNRDISFNDNSKKNSNIDLRNYNRKSVIESSINNRNLETENHLIPNKNSDNTINYRHQVVGNSKNVNTIRDNRDYSLNGRNQVLRTPDDPINNENQVLGKHQNHDSINNENLQINNRNLNFNEQLVTIKPNNFHNLGMNTNIRQVQKLSDISMDDLQNTWNKMKRTNSRLNKYDNANAMNNKIVIAHAVPSLYHQDYVDEDDYSSGTIRPDFCKSCFNYNFPIIIHHPQLCKSTKKIQLLLLISSAPDNRESRVIIRKTWAAKCRQHNSGLKCLFVIGRSINKSINTNLLTENKIYGDILQIDFQDSYANLTYKTMSSFKWAAKFCTNAQFVMKTDDDMYVNTELIPLMLQAAPRVKFVGGYCWGTSRPNRDLASKWFVSYRMFQKPRFPPMCSGTGYILSMDVVQKILLASHNVPFFHLEDVYVSLCLQKFGIMPNNILGFSNMYTEFDACLYRNSVLTSHQFPSKMLEDFWPVIQDCPPKNVSPTNLYIVIPYPLVE